MRVFPSQNLFFLYEAKYHRVCLEGLCVGQISISNTSGTQCNVIHSIEIQVISTEHENVQAKYTKYLMFVPRGCNMQNNMITVQKHVHFGRVSFSIIFGMEGVIAAGPSSILCNAQKAC